MPSAKRVLGRGLADLIPVGGREGTGSIEAREVSLASLHANPRQPRTHFDDAALAELADSIKQSGILQPILVRPRTAGGFEIVAGERRYRAAMRAGLARVPIVVRDIDDEDALALALVENLLREDIGPLETARAFRRLMDDFRWTQEELSQRVGKSRTAVTNVLRLLRLPAPLQESLEKGEITEGHARALLGAEGASPEHQRKVWQMIRTKGLSVREAERLMRAESRPRETPERPRAERPTELSALEDRLRAALGTRVRLSGDESRGRIEIEYFSDDELDRLINLLEGTEAEEEPRPPRPGSGRSPRLPLSRPSR